MGCPWRTSSVSAIVAFDKPYAGYLDDMVLVGRDRRDVYDNLPHS